MFKNFDLSKMQEAMKAMEEMASEDTAMGNRIRSMLSNTPMNEEQEIENHNKLREECIKTFAEYKCHVAQINIMGTPLTKISTSNDKVLPSSCTPISVEDLKVNTTHKRRVLRGELIVKPAIIKGI